ncbi:MAG: type II toxin-antitoxin system RelE/ParE family toxin [Bacteroidota bacterium]|nr:type II toxin-antitoxin system RelE/ParE family toxin [Bacteroidota bacterium]
MSHQLVFSPEFLSGFFEIEFYLREFEGDKRAEKVVQSIEKELINIQANPLHYPKFDKIFPTNENIRKAIVHRTYIIIFELINESIFVLRIYHGKQNII